MTRKRKIAIGLAVALMACLGWGGVWWKRSGEQQAIVAAAVPALPSPGNLPEAFRQRVVEATQHATGRVKAVAGLAELGRVYHANGFYDEARRCYATLEHLEPEEPKWPYWHATILAGYGDIEPAIGLLKRVVALAPTYRPAWLRLGDCEAKSNRSMEAEAAYRRCLALEPNDYYALLGLARIDLEAGRDDAARARLETVSQGTNFQLGYDLIVSLYERIGLVERAAQIRGAAKASGAYRDPADPWLDAIMDDCYDPYRLSVEAGARARRGEPQPALRLLRRAIELAPADVSAVFQLGNLLEEQGDLVGARENFERCTVLAPDFPDGWAHLSGLHAGMRDADAAAKTLSKGLQNCPDSPGLHLMAARRFLQAGRTDEAIGEFTRSIRLRPEEPEARVELANTLIGAGRTEAGIEELKRALMAEPGFPPALGTLAFYSIVSGDETEARRWLAEVARQPRMPADIMSRLAAAYREQFNRDWVR